MAGKKTRITGRRTDNLAIELQLLKAGLAVPANRTSPDMMTTLAPITPSPTHAMPQAVRDTTFSHEDTMAGTFPGSFLCPLRFWCRSSAGFVASCDARLHLRGEVAARPTFGPLRVDWRLKVLPILCA
jgi:hypothetical protein